MPVAEHIGLHHQPIADNPLDGGLSAVHLRCHALNDRTTSSTHIPLLSSKTFGLKSDTANSGAGVPVSVQSPSRNRVRGQGYSSGTATAVQTADGGPRAAIRTLFLAAERLPDADRLFHHAGNLLEHIADLLLFRMRKLQQLVPKTRNLARADCVSAAFCPPS